MEPRIPSRLVLAALLLVSLGLSACTGNGQTTIGEDDRSTAGQSSSGPDTTTPDTTTPDADPPNAIDPEADNPTDNSGSGDTPRIVPPLELPASAPGTDEAAQDLIDDLSRFLTDDQIAEGVPWPDMRNPDPIAVYQSDADFQRWMTENNPTPSLVDAYTAPGSPERGFDLEMFEFLNSFDLRAGPATPPYSMRVEDLVHPSATGITDALLAQVPEGSAAVVYWDSVGPSDTFTAEGQFWGSNEGWTDVGPWVAIMAPTDVGWQVWWDELTEPPPPGSRQNQGAPQEQPDRRDV